MSRCYYVPTTSATGPLDHRLAWPHGSTRRLSSNTGRFPTGPSQARTAACTTHVSTSQPSPARSTCVSQTPWYVHTYSVLPLARISGWVVNYHGAASRWVRSAAAGRHIMFQTARIAAFCSDAASDLTSAWLMLGREQNAPACSPLARLMPQGRPAGGNQTVLSKLWFPPLMVC